MCKPLLMHGAYSTVPSQSFCLPVADVHRSLLGVHISLPQSMATRYGKNNSGVMLRDNKGQIDVHLPRELERIMVAQYRVRRVISHKSAPRHHRAHSPPYSFRATQTLSTAAR